MLTSPMRYGLTDDYWMFGGVCPACGESHGDIQFRVHVDPQTNDLYIECPTTGKPVAGIYS